MSKLHRMLLTGALCAGIAACKDSLNVENKNNANEDRALARPSDVEALIAGSFNTMHRATLGASTLAPQTYTLGMENYSALANFNMSSRAAIPRLPIANGRGNSVATENFAPYLGLHRAARSAALGYSRVKQTTFTFFPPSATQTARAKAMANFVIGAALGYVAMVYDSGNAINEDDDLTSIVPLPFVGYDSLGKYALAKLDTAAAAALNTGTNDFPGTWFSNGAALKQAQFIGLVRGWQARIRAGVARTPTERAAVDWTRVNQDGTAFLTAFTVAGAQTDFVQALSPANGWDYAWLPTMYQSASVNWHMIWGFMAYFAADQASFDGWLATPPNLRTPLNPMVTPDLRWPQGATRGAQQADLSAARYMENRSSDWAGDPSANSQYRHKRWLALNTAGRVGNFPSMTAAEIRLLVAEGNYRLGNFATAAALVDSTRIARGGLPSLVTAGVTNATTLVPGGATCVPRIPVGPTFTSSQCGTLWEALKYEKRIETQYTSWSNWWFDGRGWGDMPAGTPPSWPVPYQEMDARLKPFYDLAGPATPGTYGI